MPTVGQVEIELGMGLLDPFQKDDLYCSVCDTHASVIDSLT